MMFIFTPTVEAPKETYQVRAYLNFLSDERRIPFRKGDVVRLINPLELVDLKDYQFKF